MGNMVLPGTPQLKGVLVEHPFPIELQHDPKFRLMQETWHRHGAVSSRVQRFLPPMPPASLFGLEAYKYFEVYTDWLATKPAPKWQDGQVGVIVKNISSKPVGVIIWRWWTGTEFVCLVKEGAKISALSMDIYAAKHMPT